MATRNITKLGIVMQDIAQGIGDITQKRNNVDYTVGQQDVRYPVINATDMQDLDVTVFTLARVYDTTCTRFVDYKYDAARSDGLASNTGPGVWVLIAPPIFVAGTAQLEDISDFINTQDFKQHGTQIFNVNTNKPLWATGNTDAAVWVDATGSTAHTPV